jgi:FKBP-type peptidyl-prolyl cis-trans isomerase
VGSGEVAEVGDDVEMSYVGKIHGIPMGPQFDAAKSFVFTLGAGDVIKGWDLGVKGMRVGGERTLVVPPKLGYGKKGSGPDIPPDSTLHFKVTLKSIKQ